MPVGGRSFWLLSVLTALGTTCPAGDVEQGLGIWPQEVKNGESRYLLFTLVVSFSPKDLALSTFP